MSTFSPTPKGTYLLAAAITNTALVLPRTGSSVRIYNSGAAVVYVEFGAAAVIPVAGTPGAFPIPAGATVLLEKGNSVGINAISSSGTINLFVTVGFGDSTI